MAGALRALHEAVRDVAREVARYWPRALITFAVGALVLIAIRQPLFQQSLLGEPDRGMLTEAYRLRTDVLVGEGDPALLIDIDNATVAAQAAAAPGREPAEATSRGLIADLLAYVRASPPGRGPKAVILDVDIAAPANDPDGEARLRQALSAWAADPHAPTLIISREAFPAELAGGTGPVPVLPTSPYDDVVAGAGDIYWGAVKVLTDRNGVAQEFLPYQCVQTGGHVEPLFAAAILAYATMQNGKVPQTAHVRPWMDQAGPACRAHPEKAILHGEDINYNLSLMRDAANAVWPPLPKSWPGYRVCGPETDASVFRRLSAGVVRAAGPDASHDILCQRLVVIGGTNFVNNDYVQTPLYEMPGAMVLIDATRGLQISGGGLRQIPLLLQLLLLAVISVSITTLFTLSGRARRAYRRRRSAMSRWWREIVLLPLNPVVLNLSATLAAHWLGVGLMMVALQFGYWGFLSGPAFGAAIAETIQDFNDERS